MHGYKWPINSPRTRSLCFCFVSVSVRVFSCFPIFLVLRDGVAAASTLRMPPLLLQAGVFDGTAMEKIRALAEHTEGPRYGRP